MEPVITRRTFTVDEYYRMAEAGVLAEDERIELIEGEIIATSPVGNRHMACVNRLTRLFSDSAGQAAIVSVQNPLRIGRYSVPEPDIALFRFRHDFYADTSPTPDDTILIVEVSDTTREYDRRVKIPLYAEAGITETWIVDLQSNTIEVYTHPTGKVYSGIRVVQRGEVIQLTGIEGGIIAADDVLR